METEQCVSLELQVQLKDSVQWYKIPGDMEIFI